QYRALKCIPCPLPYFLGVHLRHVSTSDCEKDPRPSPRAVVTTKALTVWIAALIVYVGAMFGRTSVGVAGVEAIARFDVGASRVAVFASIQIGTYALARSEERRVGKGCRGGW